MYTVHVPGIMHNQIYYCMFIFIYLFIYLFVYLFVVLILFYFMQYYRRLCMNMWDIIIIYSKRKDYAPNMSNLSFQSRLLFRRKAETLAQSYLSVNFKEKTTVEFMEARRRLCECAF